MTDAVSIERLVKHYGETRALQGIDLTVRQGELFGFLGPNGAGKSTAIRILLDLIRPTSGHAAIFGHDCQADSVAARRLTGYLPSSPVFPPKMTAMEVFAYRDAIRGEAGDRADRNALIERLRLQPHRPVAQLSRGNQQKVGLIQALLGRPSLVILDEPTTGLDPLMQAEVKTILRERTAEGATVFFSSHILEEVESICDRVAIIRDGVLVSLFDLEEHRRTAPVRVELLWAAPPPPRAFEALPAGLRLEHLDDDRAIFEVDGSVDGNVDGNVDALLERLTHCSVARLIAREASLNETFVRYYSGESTDVASEPAGDAGSATDAR